MSDTVRRAQAGDHAAFEELYREHAGRVYAVCLRLTGDAAQAEERTQDVFVRAWHRLGTFRDESALSSWLYRIAVNTVLMARRSERRREARVITDGDLGSYDRGRPADVGARMDLERAIGLLPAGAREVFVLHDVEGYRHDEIAQLCGIAAGTSKAQLFRARRLLRERLDR